MKIGILNSNVNTGSDSEITVEFVAPISFVSNQPAFAGDSMSLRQTIVSMNTQRWELTANICPTNNSAASLISSVSSGHNRIIYVRVPQVVRVNEIQKSYSQIKLDLPAIKGNSILIISGNSSKKIVEGEFINVGNDKKVYLVTKVSVDGVAITVFPSLRRDTGVGAEIFYASKTTMAARYSIDTILGMKYIDGVLMDQGANTFIEAL